MKSKALVVLFFLGLFGCTSETEFKFDLSDSTILKGQLDQFINDLNSDQDLSQKYRDDNVRWWNSTFNGMTHGEGKRIPSDLPLNKIALLQDLRRDSLFISGDTIHGLICVKGIESPDGKTQVDSSLKHLISLVLSDKGKISGIVSTTVVSIGSFYMDEAEISSNEYRVWEAPELTRKQTDSIEFHRNDYKLAEDLK